MPIVRKAAAVTGEPGCEPQAVLVFSAQFGRVMERCRGVAYATLLKEVGALMEAVHLVAGALGLGTCALGAGDGRDFEEATGECLWESSSIGEMVLGRAVRRE